MGWEELATGWKAAIIIGTILAIALCQHLVRVHLARRGLHRRHWAERVVIEDHLNAEKALEEEAEEKWRNWAYSLVVND